MPFRLAIFDFDGTLADSFPWFVRALGEVAEKFDLRRIGAGEVEDLRALETRAILKYLGVPFWKLPAIAQDMRARAGRDRASIPLFSGTPALLRALTEAKIGVAIVSSNGEENVRKVLGEHAALVSHYACGASLFGKSLLLKKVLKAAAVTPKDAIYIGDELRDIDAARKVGLAAGVVSWGYAAPGALRGRKPDFLFTDMEEIEKTLRS